MPSSLSGSGPSLVAIGGFGAVIAPNKAPNPPNGNMKYKSVEFLSIFRMSSPATQTQSPSIEDFLDRLLKHENIQSYIKWPVSLLGFNTAQRWKSLLWPGCGKWNGQHIAAILAVSSTILAQHDLCLTSETMRLLKCFEISKQTQSLPQNCHGGVTKTIIMANTVHHRLQGSYFSIRYPFFQNPIN